MEATTPTLFLIGGPNGAGKTTFAKEYLPNEAQCLRFLNSDEIAKGLSPFDSAAGQIQAARILLANLRNHIERRENFALESTLSGKTYVKYLERAKEVGFSIELHFLWLPSVEESKERVKQRVLEGGHAVPEKDLYRRFPRVNEHFIEDYLPLADDWCVWDASKLPLEIIAESASLTKEELREML
jgi:predicted ABC-type ATPase